MAYLYAKSVPGIGAKSVSARQHSNPRTLPAISWSEGCVYTVVVKGLTCLANLCARNRSLLAR